MGTWCGWIALSHNALCCSRGLGIYPHPVPIIFPFYHVPVVVSYFLYNIVLNEVWGWEWGRDRRRHASLWRKRFARPC